MRPLLVELPTPRFDLLPCVRQVGEPVKVQALVAELAVEALDERVLHGLAGPDEVQLHSALIRPGVERLAGELRSVVADDQFRRSAHDNELFENTRYATTADRRVHEQRQRLAREVVDHREDPEAPALPRRI